MLNFISPGKDGATDDEPGAENTRAWLASLATADTTSTARALIERLVALNRADLPTRLRVRLLDLFRERVELLLPELQPRVANATPPLSGPLRQVAYLIEKLQKELAAGYASIVLRAPRAWLSLGFKRQVHVPLVRAMDFHARRLALSQQLYAREPNAVWAELHLLYKLACEWEIAERDIDDSKRSPARIYRDALLLAFAQPQRLPPGDFVRVQAYVASWSHLAELQTGAVIVDPICVFAIDPTRDKAGIAHAKRHDAGFDNGNLVLVTTRLVEQLDTQLKKLRQGALAPSVELPAEAEQPSFQDLMQRLADNWRGERALRSSRLRFHPRTELWVGLHDTWQMLKSDRTLAAADAAKTKAIPLAASAGEWIIINESPRGFALKYMSGALPQIAVGDVAALRGTRRNSLHVCIVRWVISNSPEHFELGLEQLAPVVVPATLRSEETPPEPVLLIPALPTQQRSARLIALAQRMKPDQTFELEHPRGRLGLRIARVVEVTPRLETFEVDKSSAD